MEKTYTAQRLTALLCCFMFIFSLFLTGCAGVRRVEKPDNGENDDIINIGDGYSDIPEDYSIVVGEDGQSYLVDGEGNSIVYNPATSFVDPNATTTTTTTTTGTTTTTTSTTSSTEAPKPTDPIKTETDVYNALAIQRRFGFNKVYDNFAGLANFYLDTIRVYFTYDNKDWLIELWKGEYAMASVGCEIGFYYNDRPSSTSDGPLDASIGENKHFKSVEDKDAMYCSMELWQYVKSTDATPVKRITFGRRKCWWAAQFENGVLEKHSDRTTLVMRGTIEFPTTTMMNLFLDGLDQRGFKEGNTSSYEYYETYSVSGKKVTVNWRYYDEDKFQENR